MKLINVGDIYSRHFDCPILDIPYIDMVKEFLETDTSILDTKYYKYLVNLLKTHGCVWGWIKSEEDCVKRTIQFINIIKSIKEVGFKDINTITKIGELPYGKITYIKENGRIQIIDGHHRTSVLIYLGIKRFEIKENYIFPIYESGTIQI